jgi:hypothetical protein
VNTWGIAWFLGCGVVIVIPRTLGSRKGRLDTAELLENFVYAGSFLIVYVYRCSMVGRGFVQLRSSMLGLLQI